VRDAEPNSWDAAARAGGALNEHDAIDIASERSNVDRSEAQ
jgi:hypothetical protein